MSTETTDFDYGEPVPDEDLHEDAAPSGNGRGHLTGEQILALDDRVVEPLHVEEWSGTVHVRSLTEDEWNDIEEVSIIKRRDKKGQVVARDFRERHARARVCAAALCAPSGDPLYGKGDERAVKALAGKNLGALNRVWRVAARLSGITDDDVEELAGNSEGDLDDEHS